VITTQRRTQRSAKTFHTKAQGKQRLTGLSLRSSLDCSLGEVGTNQGTGRIGLKFKRLLLCLSFAPWRFFASFASKEKTHTHGGFPKNKNALRKEGIFLSRRLVKFKFFVSSDRTPWSFQELGGLLEDWTIVFQALVS
jgi:hypothetical protein